MTQRKTAEQSRLCTLQGGTTGMRTVSASTKELTAASNSVSGHKHIAQRYHRRVCDWSVVVRDERRARKEQSRWTASPRKRCEEWSRHGTGAQRMCSGCGMQHTSGENLVSSLKSPFGGAGG